MNYLNFHFNIIGVTVTKITNTNPACYPTIPGLESDLSTLPHLLPLEVL